MRLRRPALESLASRQGDGPAVLSWQSTVARRDDSSPGFYWLRGILDSALIVHH